MCSVYMNTINVILLKSNEIMWLWFIAASKDNFFKASLSIVLCKQYNLMSLENLTIKTKLYISIGTRWLCKTSNLYIIDYNYTIQWESLTKGNFDESSLQQL